MPTIVFPTVRLTAGGAEQQLLELVRGLDKQRFTPIVAPLLPGGSLEPAYRAVPGVEIVCLDRRGKFDLSVFWKLFRLLGTRDADIVQPFVNPASVVGLIAALLAQTPVTIATERSGVRRFRKLGARVYQRLENALLRVADVAVANSEAGRRLLIDSGMSSGRTRVIANGINPERLCPDPERVRQLRERVGAVDGAPIVGVLASLTPAKDHRTFLRAAAAVGATWPEARFAVVGEGPLRHEIELLAAQIGVSERVTFFGFQSRVADFLELFDVLVSSSRDNEGHSNSILEAMAAGVPVVATDVGGNQELVRHDESGLLVPAGNHQALASAVLAILDSPSLAAHFADRGRVIIEERFTLDRMVRAYEALYVDLLRVKRRGRPVHATPAEPARLASTRAARSTPAPTRTALANQSESRVTQPRSADARSAHLSAHGR